MTIYTTENFELVFSEDNKNLYIYRVFENKERVNIAAVKYSQTTNTSFIISNGPNIQDYIISWELYTEFVKVLDEAFTYFDLNKDKIFTWEVQ